MSYIKEFMVIVLVSFVGEVLHAFLPLPVPSSIYGLVIMLGLLIGGVVKMHHVKNAGTFLIEIMPLMFIPAGVGLMTAWSSIAPILVPLAIMTVISTILVFGVSGRTAQVMMELEEKETKREPEVKMVGVSHHE